jgi:putative ABC transport system permease protein
MWGYYVALALRSSLRSKALTVLVITLLAFGVAACMVSYAVFRAKRETHAIVGRR